MTASMFCVPFLSASRGRGVGDRSGRGRTYKPREGGGALLFLCFLFFKLNSRGLMQSICKGMCCLQPPCLWVLHLKGKVWDQGSKIVFANQIKSNKKKRVFFFIYIFFLKEKRMRVRPFTLCRLKYFTSNWLLKNAHHRKYFFTYLMKTSFITK